MMNGPCPEEYHLVGVQGSIDMQVRVLQKSHRCSGLHTGNRIGKKMKQKKKIVRPLAEVRAEITLLISKE